MNPYLTQPLLVVWPDNSVEIDGKRVPWKIKDFQDYRIPCERYACGAGTAIRREQGGFEMIIFPTKERPQPEDQGTVYADAKRSVIRRQGRLIREHEWREGILFLKCVRCKEFKDEAQFSKSQARYFQRYSYCRTCARSFSFGLLDSRKAMQARQSIVRLLKKLNARLYSIQEYGYSIFPEWAPKGDYRELKLTIEKEK